MHQGLGNWLLPTETPLTGVTGRDCEHSSQRAGFGGWHLQSLHRARAKTASAEMSGIAPLGGRCWEVCWCAARLGSDWLQLTARYLPPITGLLNLLKGLWRLPSPKGVGGWRTDFGNAN